MENKTKILHLPEILLQSIEGQALSYKENLGTEFYKLSPAKIFLKPHFSWSVLGRKQVI